MHNPFDETHRASCLRENLTSSSYGEGLETDGAGLTYRASPLPGNRPTLVSEPSRRLMKASGRSDFGPLSRNSELVGFADQEFEGSVRATPSLVQNFARCRFVGKH
jgi:hypothetical protein